MRQFIKLSLLVFVLLFLSELICRFSLRLVNSIKARYKSSVFSYTACLLFLKSFQNFSNAFQKLVNWVFWFENDVNELLSIFYFNFDQKSEKVDYNFFNGYKVTAQKVVEKEQLLTCKLSDYYRLFRDKTFWFELINN